MANIVITNIEEFKQELQEYLEKRMMVFGELLVTEIQNLIEEIPLYQTGDLLRRIHSFVDSEGNLIIENGVFYGIYLEYGTYGYWNQYGLDKFNEPLHPKKKDMISQMKKNFPKGMQPFAPMRRVLWNKPLMENKLSEALE